MVQPEDVVWFEAVIGDAALAKIPTEVVFGFLAGMLVGVVVVVVVVVGSGGRAGMFVWVVVEAQLSPMALVEGFGFGDMVLVVADTVDGAGVLVGVVHEVGIGVSVVVVGCCALRAYLYFSGGLLQLQRWL